MENQKHPQGYTQEEIMKNLKEAIELQKLQTELQELRTKMVTARANEIFTTLQMEEVLATKKEQNPLEDGVDVPKQKEVPTEKKLKTK